MILNELFLSHHSDEFCLQTGIDTKELCADKSHFLNYKKQIHYCYNSRGFRDDEWPDDLNQIYDNAWCIGDSFTVGLGQPQEETWPYLVKNNIPELVFNVSLNGASNDWIARKTNYVIGYAKPKYIFIQWSYLHRREHPDSSVCDEDRRLHYTHLSISDTAKDQRDFDNFIKNLNSIKHDAIIVHSFVPGFADNAKLKFQIYGELDQRKLLYFPVVDPLDKARDGHHYDVLTAQKYVDLYLDKIKNLR